MFSHINNLHAFYSSHLGITTQRVIGKHIAEVWTGVKGLNVLGIGFTSPYLDGFRNEAKRVVLAIPVAGHVINWPNERINEGCLTPETVLPLPDLSMDRVLIVHALEHLEAVRPLLREVWRVLSESGRLIVIAPNRRGIWARLDRTPFGHGQPYSPTQLSKLLRDTMFNPINSSGVLYVPPSKSRVVLSATPAVEKFGRQFFSAISGVVSVEANKEIYAGTLTGETYTRRVYSTIPSQ